MIATVRLAAPARRRQILEVATRLFAKQGFRGTTTREIATLARVNEALIFRHFPSKEGLYWAVLESQCRAADARGRLRRVLETSVGEGEALTRLAEDILERNTRDATLARLLFFSALERHRLTDRYYRSFGTAYVDDLARYVRARVRDGRFRRVDPELAARAFLGMVVHRFLVHELFGGKRRERLDIPRVCRGIADLWLQSMRAPRAARSGR